MDFLELLKILLTANQLNPAKPTHKLHNTHCFLQQLRCTSRQTEASDFALPHFTSNYKLVALRGSVDVWSVYTSL